MEAQPNPDPRPALWSPKLGERGMNELHYAAYCQHVEGVKYWVDAGLDVNQKDETGYTPLAWCIDMAATGGIGAAESIFDYLLMHGARMEFSDERYANILEFAQATDGYLAEHIERRLKSKESEHERS